MTYQPTKTGKKTKAKTSRKKTHRYWKKKEPIMEYGTSKLEDRFASEFLDKLGVQYNRQYLAKDIKRYYDFIVKIPNGGNLLVEVDGDYW